MKDKTAFVSGANRGIGLALTRELAGQGYSVVAGYRDRSKANELVSDAERLSVMPVDVDVIDEASLSRLFRFIDERFGYLDLLINNAGVNLRYDALLEDIDWRDIEENFRVNVGGPFLTTQYLYPLMKKSREKKIVNITSNMGSMSNNTGGATPYRVSKAALNMLTSNQASQYKSDGVTVVAMHPGWVRTDMGGQTAPLSAEESASKIAGVIETLTPAKGGQFLSPEGVVLPY